MYKCIASICVSLLAILCSTIIVSAQDTPDIYFPFTASKLEQSGQNSGVAVNTKQPSLSSIPFGSLADGTVGVIAGDIDNDGDIDIVTANSGCPPGPITVCNEGALNHISLNNGSGGIPAGQLNDCEQLPENVRCIGDSKDRSVDIALADLNDDGFLDIIVANFTQPNRIYLNDKTGSFPNHLAADFGTGTDSTRSIAVGDVDGDRDFDIIVANEQNEQNVVYLNSGTGVFHQGPIDCANSGDFYRCFGERDDFSWSVNLADVDNNESLDIIVGNKDTTNVIYLNDGTGDFYQGPVDCASVETPYRCFGWGSDPTHYIAVGDFNHDSWIDIVAGNFNTPNAVYLNDGAGNYHYGSVNCSTPDTFAYHCFDDVLGTSSLSVGDLNGDGNLNIVSANVPQDLSHGQNHVFDTYYDLTHGLIIQRGITFGRTSDYTWDVGLFDIDNNGALDIITANANATNDVYLSDGSGAANSYYQIPNSDDNTSDIVIGDLNNDGVRDIRWVSGGSSLGLADFDADNSIDVAVGVYGGVNYISFTEVSNKQSVTSAKVTSTMLSISSNCAAESSHCFGTSNDKTRSIATGDIDKDGDLDIVAGNTGAPNMIYFNNGWGDFYLGPLDCQKQLTGAYCLDLENDETTSIAIVDLNGDGLLDVVVGNFFEPNKVFLQLSDGGFKSNNFGTMLDRTLAVAVADLNGDGFPDIAVGNKFEQNVVYLNDGRGIFYTGAIICSDLSQSYWCFGEANKESRSVKLRDMNGDGVIDVVVGNKEETNEIFYTDKLGRFVGRWTFGNIALNTTSLAIDDLTNDGIPDVVVGNLGEPNQWFINHGRTSHSMQFSGLQLERPDSTGAAPYLSSPAILSSRIISIPFILSSPSETTTRLVRAYFSPDGGGKWYSAQPTEGFFETELVSDVNGIEHIYPWDVHKSGLFGQSDNVVFRLEAYHSFRPQINQKAVIEPWPYIASMTFPFRVRGTQVRILDDEGMPVDRAFIHRQKEGTTEPSQFGSNGIPFESSSQGYLQGRGELHPGDELMALSPITISEKYIAYHISASSAISEVESYEVVSSGVQTLTVSSENPLILFNLDASLEWDASNDDVYMSQLEQNLQKTSSALYDWSNGQVALGKVTVHKNRHNWESADIRIYASNKLRPTASRGGVVTTTKALTSSGSIVLTEPITVAPGNVHIGAFWSRYGDPNDLGNDWSNVLAHELAHFLLFLEDTYLKIDPETGRLVAHNECRNSAMSDPYDLTGSELRFDDGTDAWEIECGPSLAERPAWEIMKLAYPILQIPQVVNEGPSYTPFAFTEVEIINSQVSGNPLRIDPNIALGATADQFSGGRGYLIQKSAMGEAENIIDLGQPVEQTLIARGAREDDDVCIFGSNHFACATLAGQSQPNLSSKPLWQPEITLSPVSTNTLSILVSDPATSSMGTQYNVSIYPDGAAPQQVSLQDGFAQTIALESASVDILIDIDGGIDKRLIIDYSIGSGPARLHSFDGPARLHSFDGPASSSDGSVVIFPPEGFPQDAFIALQLATSTSKSLPLGLTPIGRSYYLRPSIQLDNWESGSITFQYLGLDVLLSGVPEDNLQVYHINGSKSQSLPTQRYSDQNFVSAPLAGPGLYVLAAGYEQALTGPGWNEVPFPSSLASQPMTQALASLNGKYSIVYGCDNQTGEWSVYAPEAPEWVNNLKEMKPQEVYEIYVTENVTWTVGSSPITASAINPCSQHPPATFYGELANGLTTTDDIIITAKVDGVVCGQTIAKQDDERILFSIYVAADSLSGTPSCGRVDKLVSFEVNGVPTTVEESWNNQGIQSLGALQLSHVPNQVKEKPVLEHKLFLPLVKR